MGSIEGWMTPGRAILIAKTRTKMIAIRLLRIKLELKYSKLEFGMYPQSMPTEWTHARTLRPWQSVRLDL